LKKNTTSHIIITPKITEKKHHIPYNNNPKIFEKKHHIPYNNNPKITEKTPTISN
jgi:hypothetical protein